MQTVQKPCETCRRLPAVCPEGLCVSCAAALDLAAPVYVVPPALADAPEIALDATGRCADCAGCEPTCGAAAADYTPGPRLTAAEVRARLGMGAER